jgi:cytochrome c biogenesis protein CcmG/thiol:disulfide interchange protein DsbE
LPEFSLADLWDQESHFSKNDLRGKYSLVNFFASWCSTCVAEHATLFTLKQQGFVDLYGVAWQDLNENTLKFLQEKGNPYLKVIADGTGEFSKITNLQAVPETWLVNPKGVVVLRWQGNLQDFAIEELEKYIRAN